MKILSILNMLLVSLSQWSCIVPESNSDLGNSYVNEVEYGEVQNVSDLEPVGSAADLGDPISNDTDMFFGEQIQQQTPLIQDYGMKLFEDPDCKLTDDKFEYGARVTRTEFQKTQHVELGDDTKKFKEVILVGKRKQDRIPNEEGACIDTSKDRPVIRLAKSDKEYFFPNLRDRDYEFAANVEMGDGFYLAAFPINKVKAMYFLLNKNHYVIKQFGTHSQVLVLFEEPVQLKSQNSNGNYKTRKEKAFIFSVQSANPIDNYEDSSISDGSRLLAYTIQVASHKSYEDFVSIYEVDDVEAAKLKFAKERYYGEYISKYLSMGSKRLSRYFIIDTLFIDDNQSCNIEQIRLFDRITGYNQDPLKLFTNPAAAIGKAAPHLAYAALRDRDLIDGPILRFADVEDFLRFIKK